MALFFTTGSLPCLRRHAFFFFGTYIGMYLHFFPSACCHPKASKITIYYLLASLARTWAISLAFAAFIYLNRSKNAKRIQPFFFVLVSALGLCQYLCYLLKCCLQSTLVTLVFAIFQWVSWPYRFPTTLYLYFPFYLYRQVTKHVTNEVGRKPPKKANMELKQGKC
jgi:hypothetical protein